MNMHLFCTLLLVALTSCRAFVAPQTSRSVVSASESLLTLNEQAKKGFFQRIGSSVGEFFDELDAFVDDATTRRLGNGSYFYGKRKSSFYGENDRNRKRDRDVFDATEDYRGPSSAGYFKWMPDENGQLRPVTRMKEQIVEKKTFFGEQFFKDLNDDE